MKNSLNRLLVKHRSRRRRIVPSFPTTNQAIIGQPKVVGFSGDVGEQQPTLTDELRK